MLLQIRYIKKNSIGCRERNIIIYKWEIDNFKFKIVIIIKNFGRKLALETSKCKLRNKASVSDVLFDDSWNFIVSNEKLAYS